MRPKVMATTAAMMVAMAGSAGATSDSGTEARLLALAGTGQRYAVLVEDNVQDTCGGSLPCRAYYVDITSGLPKRLGARTLAGANSPKNKTDDEVLAWYLQSITPSERRLLAGAKTVPTPCTLPYIPSSSATAVRFDLGSGDALSVDVETVWNTPSYAPYDKLSGNLCVDGSTPRCSSCARADRWHAGERFTTLACQGVGRMQVEGKSTPCDCSAEGALVRLRATRTATGQGQSGSVVLVEPGALAQNWMDGPGSTPSASVGVFVTLHNVSLTAYHVDAGIVIAGSVSHAPMFNGTFFPVFVVIPRAALPARKPVDTKSR